MKVISKTLYFFMLGMLAVGNLIAAEGGEGAHGVVHGNPSPDFNLVFKEINFILLLVGLIVLVKKPVREFFAQRALVMKKSVGESRGFYEKAMEESKVIQGKLANLESECKDIMASIKQSSEAESQKIIEQSKEFAEKIDKDARKLVQGEIARANEELKDLTIKHIQELSKEYIKKEMNTADEDRLVKKFLDRLQM